MWVRGLKLHIDYFIFIDNVVAPYVGAWIETQEYTKKDYKMRPSHPMWVRGLKLRRLKNTHIVYSRTLCGCVD